MRWKNKERNEGRTTDSGGDEGREVGEYLAGRDLVVDDKRPVEVLVKEDADQGVTGKVLGEVELFARVDPGRNSGWQGGGGQSGDGGRPVVWDGRRCLIRVGERWGFCRTDGCEDEGRFGEDKGKVRVDGDGSRGGRFGGVDAG